MVIICDRILCRRLLKGYTDTKKYHCGYPQSSKATQNVQFKDTFALKCTSFPIGNINLNFINVIFASVLYFNLSNQIQLFSKFLFKTIVLHFKHYQLHFVQLRALST